MTMGSEGRKEQTLISDQDNGIVYEDLDNAMLKEVFKKIEQFQKVLKAEFVGTM